MRPTPDTRAEARQPVVKTTWIVRTAQVHLSFRTHILAAIRLFTCQRAVFLRLLLIEVRGRNFLQTSLATFVTVVVVPFRGRRIIAFALGLSTGVAKNLYKPFRGQISLFQPIVKPFYRPCADRNFHAVSFRFNRTRNEPAGSSVVRTF